MLVRGSLHTFMPRASSPQSEPGAARFATALQRGDVAVFEQLYRAWFHDLCKYVSTFVPDDDAGDIVQDVFLSIWKNRSRVTARTDQDLFHYLLRSVRNRALDVVRHERVRDRYASAEDASQVSSEEAASSVDEVFARIGPLIETLPARSREVLILRWYHGLGFEQIASIMGISYGSTHVLHARALAMVRKQLGVP